MKKTFWSTANMAFSDAERAKYNRFRSDLYLEADRLRDLAIGGRLSVGDFRALMDLICTMPSMER
jgi:hypothetical protein